MEIPDLDCGSYTMKIAFVTVLGYTGPKAFDHVETLARSARKFGIWLRYSAYKEQWKGFVYHKVEQLKQYLPTLECLGYTHVMVLDCRDTLFTATAPEIVERYHAICPEDNAILFNADIFGHMWPLWNDRLREKIISIHGPNGLANAGLAIGRIDRYIALCEKVLEIRDQFKDGGLDNEIMRHVYTRIESEPNFSRRLKRFLNDDQFLIQIASTEYPELIKVDSEKRLLAAFRGKCREIAVRGAENPYRHSAICDALVLHYPGIWDGQLRKNALRNGFLDPPGTNR